jgi:hypothetical protein
MLFGVTVVSPTDAWAVGHYRNTRAHQTATFILHSNGAAWSKVPSPNPSRRTNELFGVSADSARDAWAVGFDRRDGAHALLLHWNGAAWSTARTPAARRSLLWGVSADSAQDAWAVGEHVAPSGVVRSLVLRWNGSAWSRSKAPSPGSTSTVLSAVTAPSPTDVWAVGTFTNQNRAVSHALVVHWDGHSWSRVATPRGRNTQLFGITAVSADDAWAVGGKFCAPVAWHWDGTTWSVVDVRKKGVCDVLSAVSADSASDAWAVGNYRGGFPKDTHTFTVHWNGTGWAHVKSPTPTLSYAFLRGVAAVSGTDAWAVGRYQDNHTGQYDTMILRWDGIRWRQH